jgi:H+-transporting ATPase
MPGLTSQEAFIRLKKYGPNSIPEGKSHDFSAFLKKFWAPIPWMLEGMIILEIYLHKPIEAGVISVLLLFNVLLSFFQEERSKKAVRLLKKQLCIAARVQRDEKWQLLPSLELVPGDFLRLRMGDIIPADVKLSDGSLLVDQSVLTGESLPIEASSGKTCYAGAVVVRGEAFAEVMATGLNSYYGKTAEIVRLAKAPSHLERTIFQIVRSLVIFDAILVLIVFLYSIYFQLPLAELIPFSLLLFIAAVPVALPAMFTLAASLGAMELVRSGVLVTRFSAIEEAAAMSILCLDKTGTITKNILELSAIHCYPGYSEQEVLAFAAFASEESTQDPMDLAILKAAKKSTLLIQRLEFIPFDPEKKYSEARVSVSGKIMQICKGAPTALLKKEFAKEVDALSADGSRVLCVTVDGRPAGLLKIHDPLREDSSEIIQEIQNLGIRVIMLTGDSVMTAKAVAERAGIGSQVITRDQPEKIRTAAAIAGVFPEDKFHIIEILQKEDYICGMTGDGVNDAPALKEAEVGIAVANATDVAKASASLVLTAPGLRSILEAIKTSRRIYQRMLTYTLNKIIKTLEISILLSAGLLFEKNFIISPLLIVLLLFANDFVTMAVATDHVSYSQKPDHWNIKNLVFIGGIFAVLILGFSFTVLFLGSRFLTLPYLQTLIFLTLAFTSQTTIYLVRDRNHFWHSAPSLWMVVSSIAAISAVSTLAIKGLFMAPLKAPFVFGLLGTILIYFVLLDFLKVKFFQHK